MDDAQPAQHPVARLTGWVRARWGLLVAVVAPIVTLLTLVIPLIADANVRTTSVETLMIGGGSEVEVAPAEEGVVTAQSAGTVGLASVEMIGEEGPDVDRVWRVRSDAPFETFPLSTVYEGAACSPAQIEWLEQWGRRYSAQVWNGYLTLSNSATDGSAMAVSNMHSVGTFTTPEVPEVAAECGGGIGAGSEIILVTQALGTTEPATFRGSYFGLPSGSPAVINIAPGQFVQMAFSFWDPDVRQISDFAGSLVADVTVGSETTQVTLFEGFTRVAQPEIESTTLRIVGEYIYCGPDGGWDDCTIDTFVSQLMADPGYIR